MSKIFNDAERLEFMALFMENYIKIGDKAYEEAGINPTTVYLWSIRYTKEFMKEYPELYKAFLNKKVEVKEENKQRGIEKTKQAHVEMNEDKSAYVSNNSIIKYLQEHNMKSIRYNNFIDVCIAVFPTCETSVNSLMRKARKFNIDITQGGKIIN